MSFKDNLIALLIIFIWGFNFVVIAWGVSDLPPLLMVAARFFLVATLGALFVRKPDIPWRWMTLYAVTLCFGQFSLLFSAVAFGMPAGLASLVIQSQAVFTLIFSALFLKEVIKVNQIIGMIFAGIGLLIIGMSGQQSEMTIVGFILTIASAIAWATGNIVNRMINQRGYKANLGLVVWSAWPAFIACIVSSVIFEGSDVIIAGLNNITISTVMVLGYLAIGASIIGYSLWSYLLGRYPAGQVAPLTLGIPVVGIVCASLFLNEVINTQQSIGIVVVMCGLVINTINGKWIKRLLLKKA